MTHGTLRLARLLWDLAWAHLLIRVATFGRPKDLTADSQLYLADIHFKLAAEYRRRHQWIRAKQHVLRANQYLEHVPREPRPAAALAMPVPRQPIFTDARGSVRPEPPDDVA